MNDASALPRKYSLTIAGHRTSVTLEPPFWRALGAMARERGLSVNALVAEIDAARQPPTGLASALRVAVLGWALARGPQG
jgi:predicted DNA-binding ribbon-helix-helix protein